MLVNICLNQSNNNVRLNIRADIGNFKIFRIYGVRIYHRINKYQIKESKMTIVVALSILTRVCELCYN